MTKTMRRTFILIALAAFPLLFGCERHEVPPQDDEMITTHLGFSIEGISIYDEALTRADDPHPYYAVSVLEYNDNTGNYEYYSYGVFDDPSKMVVSLRKTKNYNFNVALFYDFLEKGYSFTKTGGVTNSFDYVNTEPDSFLRDTTYPFYHDGYTNIFEGDAYFGFLRSYQPAATCNIELKRITTGVKIQINGVDKGTIRIKIDLSIRSYLNLSETNVLSLEISDCKMVKVANGVVYDSMIRPFTITYEDEEGKTTTVYSKDGEEFKRGFRKNITINLNDQNSTVSSTMSISKENTAMQDEEAQIIDATI